MTINEISGLQEYIDRVASTEDFSGKIKRIKDMEFIVHDYCGMPLFVEGEIMGEPIKFMIHFVTNKDRSYEEPGEIKHSYLYYWENGLVVHYFNWEGYKAAYRHFDGSTGLICEKIIDEDDYETEWDDFDKSGLEIFTFPWIETTHTAYVRVDGGDGLCTETCQFGIDDCLEEEDPEYAFDTVNRYRNLYDMTYVLEELED